MLNLASLLRSLTGDLLGDADRVNNNNNNVIPTLQFSLTALLNLRSLALKRPALSSSDLDCGRTNPTIAYTVPYPNLKKYLSNSTRNNCNNLNIIVTNPTSREFSRVDMKSLTRLCLLIDRAKLYCKRKWAYNISKFYKSKNIYIYVLQSVDEIRANVADVFDIVVSKSDEVPTRELSTLYFMWDKKQDYSAEELCDNSRKFYYLVITGEDTHCKQTIKKAYIMLLERALLILFMI
ncbi:hypothetical protein HBI23_178630 [Parastagonospora nodorum]|nr:hypothetical protein HBI23_178630 [Parastagonospora nodorum]